MEKFVDKFQALVDRVRQAMAYADRDSIHDRMIADGMTEEQFFLVWMAAEMKSDESPPV